MPESPHETSYKVTTANIKEQIDDVRLVVHSMKEVLSKQFKITERYMPKLSSKSKESSSLVSYDFKRLIDVEQQVDNNEMVVQSLTKQVTRLHTEMKLDTSAHTHDDAKAYNTGLSNRIDQEVTIITHEPLTTRSAENNLILQGQEGNYKPTLQQQKDKRNDSEKMKKHLTGHQKVLQEKHHNKPLEEALEQLKFDNKKMELKIKDIQDSKKDLQKELEDVQVDNKKKEVQIKEIEDSRKDIQKKLEDTNKLLLQAKDSRKDLRKQLEDVQDDNKKKRLQIKEIEESRKDVQKQLEDTTKLLLQANKNIMEFEENNELLLSKQESSEYTSKKLQDENDALRITNEDCQKKIEQLQEALLQAKKEHYFPLEECHHQSNLLPKYQSFSTVKN